MHRLRLLVALLLTCCLHAVARPDSTLPKQCQALREVVYQAQQRHFEAITQQRIRSSHGQQSEDGWRFSHERYTTTLPWAGAASVFIEHATDERDTLLTENWQYIATFSPRPSQTAAAAWFAEVVNQIEGCALPLADTAILVLRSVQPQALPPSLPDGLQAAYLYTLPATATQQQMAVMVGLETVKGGLRPLIIIELTTSRKRVGTLP